MIQCTAQCPHPVDGAGAPSVRAGRLPDAFEEGEDALHEERGRWFVVVGEAAVGEQVLVTGVKEQFRAFDRCGKPTSDIEFDPFVPIHRGDLERDAGRP